MKYTSIEAFYNDTIHKLLGNDETFTVLDITDPPAENRLEGENSRFDSSLDKSLERDMVIQLLCAAKENHHVNEIFLCHIEFDHKTVMALMDLIQSPIIALPQEQEQEHEQEQIQEQQKRRWTRLAIQSCPSHTMEACITLLVSGNQIESLCLYHNKLEFSGFCCVGMLLASNPEFLKILDLEDFICRRSAQSLAAGLERNTRLRTLDLHGCRLQDGETIRTLAEGIRKSQYLCELIVSSCGLADHHVNILLAVIADHPSLQEICLDQNFCQSNSCRALAYMLESNRVPNLSYLSLIQQLTRNYEQSGRHLQDLGLLGHALKSNSTLKVLSLSHNYIPLLDIQQLVGGVKDSALEELNLEFCHVTDDCAVSILSNLPPSIRQLNLTNNPFHCNKQRSQQLLLQTVDTHKNLEVLYLDRQRLGEDCWKHICHGVRMNKAGRRIFSCNERSTIISISLWPLVFDRINKIDWTLYDDKDRDEEDLASKGFREDAIFYMLQKAPILYGR